MKKNEIIQHIQRGMTLYYGYAPCKKDICCITCKQITMGYLIIYNVNHCKYTLTVDMSDDQCKSYDVTQHSLFETL